jgi:hypothetical protein
MLTLPSRGGKNFANILLFGLKSLHVYSHWAISDEFERTAPSLVFLLMLSCRLVVDWQLARRPEDEVEPDKLNPDNDLNYRGSNKAEAITNKKDN